MSERHYTLLDNFIIQADRVLHTLSNTVNATRPNPAVNLAEPVLSAQKKTHAGGLMRVDHTGEICAQALYQGQALTSRTAAVREKMQQSAAEENDHLVWCKTRLDELNTHRSYLNPFWYMGSLLLGMLAGAAGDKWSLGFVAATEEQVVSHIDQHLASLPNEDEKSRAILLQMREDEAHHADVAITTGATELPLLIKQIMRLMAKIMTTSTYWI